MHLPQSVSICAGLRPLTVDPVCSLRNTRATHALHPFARTPVRSLSIQGVPCGPPVQHMCCTHLRGHNDYVAPNQKVAREVDVLMLWTASMSIYMNWGGTGLPRQHSLLLQHRNATVHNNESGGLLSQTRGPTSNGLRGAPHIFRDSSPGLAGILCAAVDSRKDWRPASELDRIGLRFFIWPGTGRAEPDSVGRSLRGPGKRRDFCPGRVASCVVPMALRAGEPIRPTGVRLQHAYSPDSRHRCGNARRTHSRGPDCVALICRPESLPCRYREGSQRAQRPGAHHPRQAGVQSVSVAGPVGPRRRAQQPARFRDPTVPDCANCQYWSEVITPVEQTAGGQPHQARGRQYQLGQPGTTGRIWGRSPRRPRKSPPATRPAPGRPSL
jgi:hypothetical protein